MRVDLIAYTKVDEARIEAALGRDFPRDPNASDAEHLIETAGRLCYMSFDRPSAKTSVNADYIRHILEVGHGSVIEHGVATFLMQGVSRSLTLELIRHRHFSYSQLSQRYVDESDAGFVEPAVIDADPRLSELFERSVLDSRHHYELLVEGLTERLGSEHPDWSKTARRKAARQAARAVLPNATETRITVTGNFRAWRHFVNMRATEHADVEIRALAIDCLRQLQGESGAVFGDYTITTLDDGTEVASSPHVAAA